MENEIMSTESPPKKVLVSRSTQCSEFICYEVCKKVFTSKIDLLEHKKQWHNPANQSWNCDEDIEQSSTVNGGSVGSLGDTSDDDNIDDDNDPDYEGEKSFQHGDKGYDNDQRNSEDEDGNSDKDDKTDSVGYHYNEGTFCEICQRSFQHPQNLKRHMDRLHKESELVCEPCKKVFTTRTAFRRHKRIAHEDKQADPSKLTCQFEICGGKIFKNAYALNQHVRLVHTKPANFACDKCDMKFKRPCDLKLHSSSHSELKEFICEQCGTGFGNPKLLRSHYRVHKIDRSKFQCEFCGKNFNYRGSLTVHVKIHTGEAPHVCDTCGWKFKTRTELNIHSRRHDESTKKTHECELCGKRYTFRKDLKYHMMRHTGLKPYSCPHCSKTFAEKNSLNKHVHTHTRSSYTCQQCHREFSTPKSLRVHKKKHHPSEPVDSLPAIPAPPQMTERELLAPLYFLSKNENPGSSYSENSPTTERETPEPLFLLPNRNEPIYYGKQPNFPVFSNGEQP